MLTANKGKERPKGKKVYIDFKNGHNKNYRWTIFNTPDITFYYWSLIHIYLREITECTVQAYTNA